MISPRAEAAVPPRSLHTHTHDDQLSLPAPPAAGREDGVCADEMGKPLQQLPHLGAGQCPTCVGEGVALPGLPTNIPTYPLLPYYRFFTLLPKLVSRSSF